MNLIANLKCLCCVVLILTLVSACSWPPDRKRGNLDITISKTKNSSMVLVKADTNNKYYS